MPTTNRNHHDSHSGVGSGRKPPGSVMSWIAGFMWVRGQGSGVAAAGAGFEQAVEVGEIITGGGEFEVVDSLLFEQLGDAFVVSPGEFAEAHAEVAVVGVDGGLPAGFRIGEGDGADLGQLFLHGIDHAQGDGVVFAGECAERTFQIVGEEVRDHKHEGLAFDRVQEEIACGWNGGAWVFGIDGQDFPDHAQDVFAAFGGWEVEQGLVGKEQQACFVAIEIGTEGDDGGEFGGEFPFTEVCATVKAGAGDVDGENDGEFTFLAEGADVRVVLAGGDIPVDKTGFVAMLVFAVILEIETAALERGLVFATEGLPGQSPRLDLKEVHSAHDFFDGVGGHVVGTGVGSPPWRRLWFAAGGGLVFGV